MPVVSENYTMKVMRKLGAGQLKNKLKCIINHRFFTTDNFHVVMYSLL